MTNRETITKRLTDRLEELTAHVRQIEGELRQPLDPNFEEQATELEDQDALEGIENAALDEIKQIQQALARVADGSYGTCVKCGGEIEPDRLEALPTATDCIACAKR